MKHFSSLAAILALVAGAMSAPANSGPPKQHKPKPDLTYFANDGSSCLFDAMSRAQELCLAQKLSCHPSDCDTLEPDVLRYYCDLWEGFPFNAPVFVDPNFPGITITPAKGPQWKKDACSKV
ncbi:uncharacterized protein PSFLO_01056 [Pseudozyma flocculosa]|uniref:Uncharacterized protein n=1 Tax=Pseudozyma flocculosa TaxID=84751 RepID=A0A5C3EV30_9BASI|nr:uncharacterized protein PSFLO_01056 [Pseudozyma flocculosa]